MVLKDNIPIDELEKRMRPGAYSRDGFLGTSESLEVVLRQDKLILQQLGLSFEQIAAELKRILLDASIQKRKLWAENSQEAVERVEAEVSSIWGDTSIFSLKNLPSPKLGLVVDGKYQVFFFQWRGSQDCPWDCVLGLDYSWGSIDFFLLNRQNGHSITAPGLIVHLIQKHQFFEGTESPYRVKPYKLAQVLGFVL